jgi:ABC-type lipoprotein release transport system permease subunit
LLYDVKASDPTTFVSVALLLVVTALFACLEPALRAALIDPMIALRHE